MLCLYLAACCPALASNVDDTLEVSIESSKTPLILPFNPTERDMVSAYSLVYEGLVTIDDNYMPQPCLAESWEESGSGRTWTFRLRRGLTFSDGTPVTAADVVASAQYILDRANDESTSSKGYYRNLNYYVNRISASGEDTVVVRAKTGRTYYGLLYAMTFPVVPATQVSRDNPMGTGPYYIENYYAGSYLILEANENWWKNQPQVKHITFRIYNTGKEVIESYERGQCDAAFTRSISAAQYKSATTSLALDYRTNQLEVLQMNQSYTKMKSLAVRKAIRAAINKDRIASDVYMGMVSRTDTPMIPGTWMYNDSATDVCEYNLEYARRLLEEDGWGDSNDNGTLDKMIDDQLIELTLNLYVYEEPDNDVRVATANMIKDNLAQVGITVTVNTVTMATMQEKLSAGSFHMALVSYAMDKVPDPGYLLISGNTGNYGRYHSSAMSELCSDLRKTVYQGDYQQKLMEIQSRFVEDCPFVCLFYRSGVVMTRLMYTTARDVRELELLRGIESFRN